MIESLEETYRVKIGTIDEACDEILDARLSGKKIDCPEAMRIFLESLLDFSRGEERVEVARKNLGQYLNLGDSYSGGRNCE